MNQLLLLFLGAFSLFACNNENPDDKKAQVKPYENDTIHIEKPIFVIFQSWMLDVNQLKLVDTIKNNAENIIWDVSKEHSIWDDTRRVENPFFPVICNSDTTGFLQISDSTLLYYDSFKKQVWKTKYATTFRKYCRAFSSGNSLFVSFYSPIATGSSLLCYDINNGKNLWIGDIKQMMISHSKYRNEVFIYKTNSRIIVAGQEAMGNILQVIDSKTGKNLFFVDDNK